jgi:hypothetical protein
MAYGGKHQPMGIVLLGANIPLTRLRAQRSRTPGGANSAAPHRRIIYARPDQSLRNSETSSEWLA